MMANEHDFEKSWTHSRREVWRMLHNFKSRPPVLTASIVAIDEARKICSHLVKSAVDAAQVLQAQEYVLEGVKPDTLAQPSTINTEAFEGKEHCKVCRHHWTEYLHVLSELEKYSRTVTHHDVEKAIKAEAGMKTSIQATIAQLQKYIDVYRSELEQLLRAAARINLWLSEVLLVPSEDAFVAGLRVLGAEEQLKVLAHLRNKYTTIVASLAHDPNNFNFRPRDRERMMQNLLKLEYYGKPLEDDCKIVTQAHPKKTDEDKNREVLCAIASSGR
jgi:hypothetical protein